MSLLERVLPFSTSKWGIAMIAIKKLCKRTSSSNLSHCCPRNRVWPLSYGPIQVFASKLLIGVIYKNAPLVRLRFKPFWLKGLFKGSLATIATTLTLPGFKGWTPVKIIHSGCGMLRQSLCVCITTIVRWNNTSLFVKFIGAPRLSHCRSITPMTNTMSW